METPEIKTSQEEQLRQQIDTLHHLVVSILILLVVISGTFTIYLLRQWQSARKDLASIKPNTTISIAAYNNGEAAKMDAFISRLVDYGKTHADFRPILLKYSLIQTTGAAPAAPAPPKK